MSVKFDFSRLPEKEQKYLKKLMVEKRLNEDIDRGAKSGFLTMKTNRFVVPYHIGRDIDEAAAGQLRFDFYSWEKKVWYREKVRRKKKVWYSKKIQSGSKAIYRWCLPGYELPTKR